MMGGGGIISFGSVVAVCNADLFTSQRPQYPALVPRGYRTARGHLTRTNGRITR